MRSFSRLLALPALVLTLSSARAGDGWVEDFEKAKATAAKENRDLLMDFTGSDWCPYCIQLKKEVFNKEAFKKEAPKNFVLVELDFPKEKEQPAEIKAQNEKLEKLYAIDGYPTVVLADSQGRPYAVIGYEEGGAAKYMEHLAELRKIREKRDEGLKKAASAEGVEKAKLIMAALEKLDENLLPVFYKKELDEAIAADKDDVTGVKLTGKIAALNEELSKLHAAEKFDEFTARIDKFIKDEKVTGTKKQELLLTKLAIFDEKDKEEEIYKVLDEVIAVDPKSDLAEQAKMIKESFKEQKDGANPKKGKKDSDEDGEDEKPADKAAKKTKDEEKK